MGEPGACRSSGGVDYNGDTNEGCPDKFFSEFLNNVLFRSESEHKVFEIFIITVFIFCVVVKKCRAEMEKITTVSTFIEKYTTLNLSFQVIQNTVVGSKT